MEQLKNIRIKEILLKSMEHHKSAKITIETLLNFQRICDGSLSNYIVWDNAGGCRFGIIERPKAYLSDILENESVLRYTFFVCLDGVEYVNRQSNVFWLIREHMPDYVAPVGRGDGYIQLFKYKNDCI